MLLLSSAAAVVRAHGPDAVQLEQLNAAIAQAPEELPLRVRRARVLIRLEEFTQALTEADTLQALHPRAAEPWMIRAEVAHAQGDLEAEESALDWAVELAPDGYQTRRMRSRFRMRTQRFEAALVDLATAHREHRTVDSALDELHALLALGRGEDALRAGEQSLTILGASTLLHEECVRAALLAGNFQAALTHLDAASRGARQQARWAVRRASILEALGDPAAARRTLVVARDELNARLERRDVAGVRILRARVLEALGESAAAARDWEAAEGLSPEYTARMREEEVGR